MTKPAEHPQISVVLPVSGVEEYLGGCLDSVLGQPLAGIEVIAVDDASPDRCGEILATRAAWDPRLRVIHLAESVGPGPARNLGLAQATGEYVWFVDPDDLLTAGSMEAVGEALGGSQPDVLLIDYRSLGPSGRTEPSPGGSLRGYQGTGSLAQWPALINRTMTSWSKVIRRDFLGQLGVPFPAGIHEDVPVSCAVLLSARRIAVLDRVCYLYRRRQRLVPGHQERGALRHLRVLRPGFRGHGRQVPGGGRVAADHPADHPGGPRRAPCSAGPWSTVARSCQAGWSRGRARRAYFHRMAADFRRYRPAGYSAPPGARGMKFHLVERDAWCRYALLEPLNRARVVARRTLGIGRARPQEKPMPALVSREPG